MDADMFVSESIGHLASSKNIKGKIVDLPNPQIEILQELYELAKFEVFPKKVQVDFDHENQTFQGNLNGGLYIIPGQKLKELKKSWNKWIDWILDSPNTLDFARKLHHTDQIAFSMAIHELGIGIENIDRRYNFPCHLPQFEDVEPIVWHYHHMLRDGVISNLNLELLNYTQSLSRVNEQIQEWLKDLSS